MLAYVDSELSYDYFSDADRSIFQKIKIEEIDKKLIVSSLW